MSETQPSAKRAVIIGAGPAGLTGAYELLERTDIAPLVLEESGEIGGISRTVRYAGNRMDIGGHRFFSKDSRVTDFWLKQLPMQGSPALDDILVPGHGKTFSPGGPDPERVEEVMLKRRRVSRIFYLGKFFDYPISLSAGTFLNMGLGRTLRAGWWFVWSQIFKREERSLEDFYINRFGRGLYEMFFEDYTEKVWGIHPSQLDADWGAQRVRGLSLWVVVRDMLCRHFGRRGRARAEEASLIEEFIYPKRGPGQLWELVAERISQRGGAVKLNTPVTEIVVKDRRVVAVRSGQKEFACDFLLCSMPIRDLVAALRGIELPEEVRKIASELAYRDFITVGVLVDKLKVKNRTRLKTWQGRIPDTWIYIQEREVKMGRLQVFNNWSPYMVGNFRDQVWIGLEYFCCEGDELWLSSDKDFIDMAVGELEKIGMIDRADVRDAVRIKVKKAYPAYWGAYHQLDRVRDFLDGIENLFCVGRNGQHRYNNMDHSMLTAMAAVDSIAAGSPDKSRVWSVNTEQEYHESK